jgi:DNA segregation ATPase FtsK/SpoIIIE, S-DNA-T family
MPNNFRKKKKTEEYPENAAGRTRKDTLQIPDDRFSLIAGGFLFLIALILLLSFVSYLFSGDVDQDLIQSRLSESIGDPNHKASNSLGQIGARLGHWFIYIWFGISAFLLIPIIFFSAFRLVFKEDLFKMNLTRFTIGSLFYLFFISMLLGYFVYSFDISTHTLCGNLGYHTNNILNDLFGTGSILIIIFILMVWMVFFHGFTRIDDYILTNYLPKKPRVSLRKNYNEETDEENELEEEPFEIIQKEPKFTPNPVSVEPKKGLDLQIVDELPTEEVDNDFVPNSLSKEPFKGADVAFTIAEHETKPASVFDVMDTENKAEDLVEAFGEYDPKLDLAGYQYPPVQLLAEYPNSGSKVNSEELEANKNKIVETLINFSIGIASIKATIGPTVTLYEIVPDAGVRISKIKNLEDDIALSLAALGIRIIAPMPGKGTIGIEVPNKNREMVSVKSIVTSEKFQKTNFDLPIILGKTISNEIYIADLAKMPHLLMAGATGQGKSVGLNVILTSLLYKKHPSEVKFILVDPKKVELTLFNKIERHFLAMLPNAEEAIITDTKKVINTLNSLCIEMDQRYDLLKEAGVRNIKEYNAKFVKRRLSPEKGHKFLPYIVLVIDELADLMMTAGKEVEQPIARLAQLARAIGIHLIVATQRPSVNVITGLIKANFPARLSFKVTAKVDSRTIMDTGGAEQLVGNGDMLLSTGSEMVRLQCPFVDTPEVESICEFIGEQKGLEAYMLPEFYGDEEPESLDFDPKELDSNFDDAARLLVIHQQGSTSLIQRKMKLGYNRAGRIIDQLEGAGIVGPFEGSKAREVLVKDLEHLEEMLRNLQRS